MTEKEDLALVRQLDKFIAQREERCDELKKRRDALYRGLQVARAMREVIGHDPADLSKIDPEDRARITAFLGSAAT